MVQYPSWEVEQGPEEKKVEKKKKERAEVKEEGERSAIYGKNARQ